MTADDKLIAISQGGAIEISLELALEVLAQERRQWQKRLVEADRRIVALEQNLEASGWGCRCPVRHSFRRNSP